MRRLSSCLLLFALTAPLSAERPSWPYEREAGKFLCHSTYELTRLEPVWQDLAVLQQDLIRQLGVPAATQPSHVFLFHNRGFYQQYVKRHFPEVAMRQALFIKTNHGPGMIFAYRHRDVEGDLRHEATHALLHAALPMVPLWLDEGLAEYFESTRSQRASGSSHLRAIRWDVRLGRVPDLADLESLARMEDMRASDYRDAWAWVHFMLHGSDAANGALKSFLADIAAHTPPGQLGERLRRHVPQLENAYLSHFRSWR